METSPIEYWKQRAARALPFALPPPQPPASAASRACGRASPAPPAASTMPSFSSASLDSASGPPVAGSGCGSAPELAAGRVPAPRHPAAALDAVPPGAAPPLPSADAAPPAVLLSSRMGDCKRPCPTASWDPCPAGAGEEEAPGPPVALPCSRPLRSHPLIACSGLWAPNCLSHPILPAGVAGGLYDTLWGRVGPEARTRDVFDLNYVTRSP